MHSNHYDIDITALENNIFNFINATGEQEPTWAETGVCNGFAFMAFRSELYKKSQEYQQRLLNISLETKESMEKMGNVLQQYRRYIQELSKAQKEVLKKALMGLDKKTQQHAIALVRKNFFNKVRRKASQKIKEKELLKKACDYYNFIHSLLAAQNPGDHLYFHVGERHVRQEDFLEILELLPVDGPKPPVKQVFNFSFNFTENELIHFFQQVLREGDHVQISSTVHAIYLVIKHGKYTLYDPVPIAIIPANGKALAEHIKENLFTGENRSDDYMPLSIHIFSENANLNKRRPEPLSLLEEMIKNRGRDKCLDKQAWDGATAIYIAAFDNCANLVERLAKEGANVNLAADDHTTPACIAAICDNSAVIKVLAKYKAKLNEANSDKNTPLHLAAKYGNSPAVQALIDCKAKTNLRNNNDDTPLMLAIRRHHWQTATQLFQHADKNIVKRDLRMLRKELKISADEMNAKLNLNPSLTRQGLFKQLKPFKTHYALKHNTLPPKPSPA